MVSKKGIKRSELIPANEKFTGCVSMKAADIRSAKGHPGKSEAN
jgi:hypothetical protein